MIQNKERGSFSAFCARGELLPNPVVLASGNQLLSQARHTSTHLHTKCRPDQSLTASTDPHYSLTYVSGSSCLASFSHFSPFLLVFPSLPNFLPSHPISPLSPKLSGSFSPQFLPLSALAICPYEICPAGFSFFLLSTQLTNPRERKRSSWMDGWGGVWEVGGKGGRWEKRYGE